MSNKTNIQWTDATWNVARGCTKVSEGCKYCYMMRDSLNGTRYNPEEVVKTKTVFKFPLRYPETKSKVWEGRPLIFTSSLTDFFHKDIDGFRNEAWDIIRKCPHLIFQILTKRADRTMLCLPPEIEFAHNIWIGISAENQARYDERIVYLKQVKEAYPNIKTFLSCEPLLEPIELNLFYPRSKYRGVVDWIIVGGESGNDKGQYRYRECNSRWIVDICDQARRAEIPVFVKQMGTYLAKQNNLSDRHGSYFDEFPINAQFRQFPKP